MKTSSILDTYQTWLTHREYSPATIQKYTKALARFFADTGAGDIPTRETVAAWRDSLTEKGYTPATVNAMLAAVNDCQESIDNVAGKAKPLKHQRRIFADPGRELTRAEYFRLLNAARAAGNKRTQLLLEALCSTGIRVSGLQFITAEAVRRHRLYQIQQHPEIIHNPKEQCNTRSIEVAQLDHEIHTALALPELDADAIIDKILRRAELQFNYCAAGDDDPTTMQIKRACKEFKPTDTFPESFYSSIVSKIILHLDTHIDIKLRNGQTL